MWLKQVLPVLAALMGKSMVDAKAVFAHFIVGNVQAFSQADWETDIATAQAAGIDGFALNIAAGDTSNGVSVQKAFDAADAKGFKLFFSFDYAAWGAWDKNAIVSYINTYKGRASYYLQGSQPLASTFEGPDNATDWFDIRSSTGAFFMPDYSSKGPQWAVNSGVVDGLFSWDAWPDGASDMTTATDQLYKNVLGGKPYMMPVSPWFFANVYNKAWVWRGEDLWYDRWQQVLQVQPELVEIITWNDYGESHYIGPLWDSEMGLFVSGNAPFNYAAGHPHDGWRLFLPYLIQQYKTGSATISQEGLSTWYRLNPNTACTADVTGNDPAGHGQQYVDPALVLQDRVFYSALLGSSATVSVSIGGVVQQGTWENVPAGGAGIYHGSVPFNGGTGQVVVTISRNGVTISEVLGASITTSCESGIENWNAWVGSATGAAPSLPGTTITTSTTSTTTSSTTTTTTPPGQQVCVSGVGSGNYQGLCSFSCSYGYCPAGVCTCTAFGTQRAPPPSTGQKGYPLAGLPDRCSYLGLCSFVYDHGYYPDTACSSDPAGASGC
ncbi:Uu.00g082840.m01.CDS01 [Anthostomella pinea]|uniref:Uu.00g082840.m01.CDS01 n=1 Tax=Anthostomella pinea TaxID=933095 RepID=A0AAI8YJP1_9PEZI|nr:Uu.00g082840.m01.CDS01 [Anthostomella pinea]